MVVEGGWMGMHTHEGIESDRAERSYPCGIWGGEPEATLPVDLLAVTVVSGSIPTLPHDGIGVDYTRRIAV
jgi:hypothetical protein